MKEPAAFRYDMLIYLISSRPGLWVQVSDTVINLLKH